jgi:hypothetical protein
MDGLDFSKRDMTVVYGDRTFALRADRERREKSRVVIENRTPIGHWLPPAADPATCSAVGGGSVAATVDSLVDIEQASGDAIRAIHRSGSDAAPACLASPGPTHPPRNQPRLK